MIKTGLIAVVILTLFILVGCGVIQHIKNSVNIDRTIINKTTK